MSDVVIRVENLGKMYRIGKAKQRHDTMRDALVGSLQYPLSLLRRDGRPDSDTSEERIWALKDVSFEVKRGEVVGIIGRNGAGKSTLLKILSRITEPTEGRARVKGRVGSLLEVGTGFHPELTGRENVFLNGAILGMSRQEIATKFDEIVAFAEIERFLDTPVKRYSSGMYVRLAFAVAAHLDPEILVVDEVLAVGDAEFQKKCLGKMQDVATTGRTVVFVSHNMVAVENLCGCAMLIEQGQITASGPTRGVVSRYLTRDRDRANPFSGCDRSGNGKLRVTAFCLRSTDGETVEHAQSGAPVIFSFQFENHYCEPDERFSFSFSVHTEREVGLFHYYSDFSNVYFRNLPGRGWFHCTLPELPLAPGDYLVGCRTVMNGDQDTGEEVDWPQARVPIKVTGGDFYGTGNAKLSTWGPILVKGEWSMSATRGLPIQQTRS